MSDDHTSEEVQADVLLRQAAAKGLGSRTGARLVAITLWASFLGAIPMLLTWLLLLPEEYATKLGLSELSFGFFMCWLAAAAPAAIAVLLTHAGSPAVPLPPEAPNEHLH
ncbi:MAG: hypothetical protein EPN60_02710 [Nevskiaceae bacterium]|jgi:hypothetical protein|nr:MAG: hypothetical protein EPO48_09215 [Nevskiaceae bacterium]TAM32996.1 MAG: hypothetical protein EPN60_02710 [Nevskiaceae bacterium]